MNAEIAALVSELRHLADVCERVMLTASVPQALRGIANRLEALAETEVKQ